MHWHWLIDSPVPGVTVSTHLLAMLLQFSCVGGLRVVRRVILACKRVMQAGHPKVEAAFHIAGPRAQGQ